MEEEKVVREDEDLLEAILGVQNPSINERGDVVDVVVRKARDRVVYDDHAVAFELAALGIELPVTDLKKVEERDQGLLTLTQRLENTVLPTRTHQAIPWQLALFANHLEALEPEHVE
ncbi:hypothetical protein D3C81_1829720 [compost metagenome]